jgi:hypothetical protein
VPDSGIQSRRGRISRCKDTGPAIAVLVGGYHTGETALGRNTEQECPWGSEGDMDLPRLRKFARWRRQFAVPSFDGFEIWSKYFNSLCSDHRFIPLKTVTEREFGTKKEMAPMAPAVLHRSATPSVLTTPVAGSCGAFSTGSSPVLSRGPVHISIEVYSECSQRNKYLSPSVRPDRILRSLLVV